jgi:hypothetical protein
MNSHERKVPLTGRIIEYLRQHALAAAAFVCSILALAGSSYAAFTISGSQIRNHTINPIKFNPRYINGTVRAWAIVAPNGTVIRGKGGARVTAELSDPGGYGIRWKVKVGRCDTDATIDYTSSPPTERLPLFGNPSVPFSAGYAVSSTNTAPRRGGNETFVQTFNQEGQPTPLGFDVAVIC